MFLFHGLSFDILEKNGGHQTNYLSGGPTPTHFEEFQLYNTLRTVFFVIYMILYFLYEVILHYKRKKEKEKKLL